MFSTARKAVALICQGYFKIDDIRAATQCDIYVLRIWYYESFCLGLEKQTKEKYYF